MTNTVELSRLSEVAFDATKKLPEFQGLDALYLTLSLFDVHLLIIIINSFLFALLQLFAGLVVREGNSPIWKRILKDFSFMLAFAAFGSATAYFLSLGIKDDGNDLVISFAAPFIALLTAAVGYVGSSPKAGLNGHGVTVGVTCFLLTTIISYRTFLYQLG